ncbi:MAG: hypothetical protein NDF56_07990 [archaeon GB-1845-036]|mgnify:CR=1 FL=1|nr:hypothetical protein [Candidatus Culexmicrobium thermophilum]RLE53441.1 MAG: hypothetical protein DRJ30_06845 [Candidatus Verstraetearchaeota archaeon]HDO21212.1 hypothetical protein [Candidatus Bathyarchaeota archaeon]
MVSIKKRDKHVYLPCELIETVEQVIRIYGKVLRVKSFSEAVEDALRRWMAWIRMNEDKIKRIMEEYRLKPSLSDEQHNYH